MNYEELYASLALFDETELMGRLAKRTRVQGYAKMHAFLLPGGGPLERCFSLFALSSSYAEDVIDRRNEFDNIASVFADDPAAGEAANAVVNMMLKAPELAPLSQEEILEVLDRLREFHGKAYDWIVDILPETLYAAAEGGGYLLRTRIRAAIEFLDQLYQYGEAGETRINEVGKEILEEDTTPLLEGFDLL